MSRFRRALDRGLEATLSALMAGMVLIVLWQVVTRFVLRSPSSVTEELVRFALLWLALLGASYGFGRNTHLAIELLPSRLTPERRIVLELAVLSTVGAFAVLVLVAGGLRLVATTLALGQSSAALGIERGYVYLALPVSGLVVVYSFLLAVVVYRELPLRDVPAVLVRSALTTAVVMLLIGCSMAFSWVLAYERVPEGIGAAFAAIGGGSVVTLLVINLLLLAAGTVLDITPAVLIFTPMLLPVVTPQGVDPVHFGIVMILNLCIGLCTPPVGNVLFVGCGVSESSIPVVSRALVPLYLAMIAALLLMTFLPEITLALPRWLGMSSR